MRRVRSHKLTSTQTILLGYFLVILIGAILLSLPISSKQREWTSFLTSFFTSTSATCVTGLSLVDTSSYWSLFGQIVIITLIQIGGIGFMTLLSIFGLFLKKKINLHERKIIMQSSGNFQISGVIYLVIKIAQLTFICEGIGALLLMIRFIPDFGVVNGIYAAIFTSISAFCNAGFDVMPGEFTSLVAYQGDILVNLVVCVLIIIGGLGFLVWMDLFFCKFKFKKLHLHSKMVLIATLVLIMVPSFLFFGFEYSYTLADLPLKNKILASFFQSVTTRTAGFNTIDMEAMSPSSKLLSIVLMLVGGSPGSTAGGIKTTTFIVLIYSIIYANRRATHITIGSRRLERNVVRQASSIFTLYITSVLVASMIILASNNNVNITQVLFECNSAIATVGLSTGITASLNTLGKIVLILLMYVGRIGALSIILLFQEKDYSVDDSIKRPTEKILVG